VAFAVIAKINKAMYNSFFKIIKFCNLNLFLGLLI
jgi:hypothetical protein